MWVSQIRLAIDLLRVEWSECRLESGKAQVLERLDQASLED